MAKNENNSSSKKVDSKTSVVNLSLNIIIFFLASLTIYLGYSIIIKLNDKPKIVEEVENKGHENGLGNKIVKETDLKGLEKGSNKRS